MSALLHSIRGFSTTNDIALQTCEGWEWGDSKIEFGGLALSTKQIKSLVLILEPDFSLYNRRWGSFEPQAIWRVRWWKLLSRFVHQCTSFILWQLFNHGYYTNQRGVLWGIDPLCPLYQVVDESTNDTCFSCALESLFDGIGFVLSLGIFILGFSHCFTLKEMISLAVSRLRRCPKFIILVSEVISTIWLECNSVVFCRNHTTVPPIVLWRKTAAQLDALEIKAENACTRRLVCSNLITINQFINSPTGFSTQQG